MGVQGDTLLSPAESDPALAMDFYDRASPGLGLEFLNEVELTVQTEGWNVKWIARHRTASRARIRISSEAVTDIDWVGAATSCWDRAQPIAAREVTVQVTNSVHLYMVR